MRIFSLKNRVMEIKEIKFESIKSKVDGKKSSLQFLPEKLCGISNAKHFEWKEKKLKVAYLIDITHTLLLKYYFKKENIFNISSLVLRDKYGFQYNYYIDYLQELGILQLQQNYLVGKNARVYKLNEEVIKGTIFRYKNCDKTLLKKYKMAVSLVDESDIDKNSILPQVKKKLVNDLFSVKIHGEKAIFYLDNTSHDLDIYNKNVYSVQCINDSQIFYHFDGYGRMHTNFTILKSFIRKNCLTIDGEETYELDIKNSQPLFLNKLINEHGLEIVDKRECQLFAWLTSKGLFYQWIMDNSDIKDKKIVKEMIYKVFFGKNFKNKIDDLFKSLLPTIYQFIKFYKKKCKDYRVLSHQLQKLESDLIFNKIILEITENHPDIKVVTVHDSLIIPISKKNIVEEIFNRNLEKEFNI